MNVSFWDKQTASAFRTRLFDEHGGFSSAEYDGREAIQELMKIAQQNTIRRSKNQPLQGFLYAIEPSEWAK